MKKRHYLTEKDLHKIRHLIETENLQQYKVAKLIGVHTGTIERICKRLSLKTQRSGPRNGAGHPKWKGGRTLGKGYWYIYQPDHPNCTSGHYVLEHRLIMEKKLGRYLSRKEVCHHIDGNPLNNSIDNLIVFGSNGEHLKHELTGKVPNWTPEGMQRIQKGVQRAANLKKLKRDGHQLLQANGVPSESGNTNQRQVS